MNHDTAPDQPNATPATTYQARKAEVVDNITAAADGPMGKGEREQLLRVVRLRAKVAKDDVSARQAQILAEGEAALARRFAEDDQAFADLTSDARAYMDGIKEKIDARAAELGIPATFRPTMSAYWFSRGENADPKRRVELRRVLQAQAEATAKAAKLEIDRWSADLHAGIIAGGLASEARELLDRLPTAEALMPPLRLPELGR